MEPLKKQRSIISITELSELNERGRTRERNYGAVRYARSISSCYGDWGELDFEFLNDLITKFHGRDASTLLCCFSSLGSIYGDISTAPLYSLNFASDATEEVVYGSISLIFYLFTVIVMTKYLLVVVYVEGDGQLAIYSKIRQHSRRNSNLIKILCLLGCSLVISDGLLTPTISVTSAVSGLTKVLSDEYSLHYLSVAILLVLLASQRFIKKISFMFPPVIFTWILCLGAIGAYNIIKCPRILLALHPVYAYNFLINNGVDSLGSAVLAITGAEALFSNLNDIGRVPVQLTLACFVYPCLMASYFGQGAFILNNISCNSNVFYASLPFTPESWLYWGMVTLAILSAIVASQSLVSVVFKVVIQLMNLNMVPKMLVHDEVYIPAVNYLLMIGLTATGLILTDPKRLAMAYGLGISLDFLVTSILIVVTLVVVYRYKVNAIIFSVFLPIEMMIIYANISKFNEGGWFTISVALMGLVYLLVYDRFC